MDKGEVMITDLLIRKLALASVALAIVVVGVLALQLLLGSLNVLWALPLKIATLHNACGALLLLCVIAVNFAPPRISEPQHE
ncbi:MAG: cytochrome c oxidase assembly protein subunit 15 [Limisphaerales bacterium]